MKLNNLNDKQLKALASLSHAFAKCRKANLSFQGMDGDLLVWDASDYRERTKGGESICEQQYLGDDGNQGEKVENHGTYMDSGGW